MNRCVGDVYEVLGDLIKTHPDADELDKLLYNPHVRVRLFSVSPFFFAENLESQICLDNMALNGINDKTLMLLSKAI